MTYDNTIIPISQKKEFSTESNTNCGKSVEKVSKTINKCLFKYN